MTAIIWKNGVFWAAAGLGLVALSAPGFSAKTPDFKPDMCRNHTRAQERTHQIPRQLLRAISLTETGRWNAARQAMLAWPWTVTAGGKGRYYPTKEAAIAATRALQAKGVKSIDVGCMQVNLFYHPRAFATLEEAFDPARNAEYAASFLKSLHRETGDWQRAAAYYHSSNPAKNGIYLQKVVRLWNQARKAATASAERIPYRPVFTQKPVPRSELLAMLNQRFRARLNAERRNGKARKRSLQMDKWRKARLNPSLMSQLAVRRKAELERRRQAELNKHQTDFASKRRQQLAAWRAQRFGLLRSR